MISTQNFRPLAVLNLFIKAGAFDDLPVLALAFGFALFALAAFSRFVLVMLLYLPWIDKGLSRDIRGLDRHSPLPIDRNLFKRCRDNIAHSFMTDLCNAFQSAT